MCERNSLGNVLHACDVSSQTARVHVFTAAKTTLLQLKAEWGRTQLWFRSDMRIIFSHQIRTYQSEQQKR